jgi:hypothetical protein
LRRKAGKKIGIRTALRHFAEEIHDCGRDGDAREFQRPLEDRDIGIEPFGCQQCAARRAGDTYDALDAKLALRHDFAERLQGLALRTIPVALEEREVLRVEAGVGTNPASTSATSPPRNGDEM